MKVVSGDGPAGIGIPGQSHTGLCLGRRGECGDDEVSSEKPRQADEFAKLTGSIASAVGLSLAAATAWRTPPVSAGGKAVIGHYNCGPLRVGDSVWNPGGGVFYQRGG